MPRKATKKSKPKRKRSGTTISKAKDGDLQVQTNGECQSSISLGRDTKGNPKWDIKVYCPNDAGSLREALKKALVLDKQLLKATMG